VLREIAGRGRIPLVCGGTGFYLRALLEGLFPGPRRREDIRAALAQRERQRPGSLHRILTRLDLYSASKIHANDVNKTIRALEVRLLERKPISELFREGRESLLGFDTIKIGLDPERDKLYERINARTAAMFEHGLIDEVRQILFRGVSGSAKPFESLGYKQALAVVRGELAYPDAVAHTQIETRRYAKRQMTWFRRERDVQWFPGFGDDADIKNAVHTQLMQRLSHKS